MKIILNMLVVGMAAAVQPLTDHTKLHDSLLVDGHIDPAIHRMLQGCKDDFQCPKNSERKANRSCFDSFQDCDCDLGYFKRGNACVAKEGLCSLEYVDMVEGKQEEVEFWIDKAEGTSDPEEKYGYLDKMNDVLSEAWDDYNEGKASCEMYVFDEVDGDDRRKLRCCSRLRSGFKKLASGFKKVVKKVVDVVIEVVDVVVAVVTEIVECGVGIATDGVKCGLIGCAFGLFGVAADIAFTLATGGVNKAVAVSCDIIELVKDDGDFSDCKTQQCRDVAKKRKKQSALVSLLVGAGDAVCAINQKMKSSVLGQVCSFSEEMRKSEGLRGAEEIAGLLFQNKVVLRFVEAFKTAMCGSPGSALTDILEEVVSCEIGCAKSGNAFCNSNDNNNNVKEDEVLEDGRGAVEYRKRSGKACRTADGGRGVKGKEFSLVKDISEEGCEKMCSDDDACKGWEFRRDRSRCELWEEEPKTFNDASDFDCYVKLD